MFASVGVKTSDGKNYIIKPNLPEIQITKVGKQAGKEPPFAPCATSTPQVKHTKNMLFQSSQIKPAASEAKKLNKQRIKKKEPAIRSRLTIGSKRANAKVDTLLPLNPTQSLPLQRNLDVQDQRCKDIEKKVSPAHAGDSSRPLSISKPHEEMEVISSSEEENMPVLKIPSMRKKSVMTLKKKGLRQRKENVCQLGSLEVIMRVGKEPVNPEKWTRTNNEDVKEEKENNGNRTPCTPSYKPSSDLSMEISPDEKVLLWLGQVPKKKCSQEEDVFVSPKQKNRGLKRKLAPKEVGKVEANKTQKKSTVKKTSLKRATGKKKTMPAKKSKMNTEKVILSILNEVKKGQTSTPNTNIEEFSTSNEKIEDVKPAANTKIEEFSMKNAKIEEVKPAANIKDTVCETIDSVAKGLIGRCKSTETETKIEDLNLVELDEELLVDRRDKCQSFDRLPTFCVNFDPMNMQVWKPVKGQIGVEFARTVRHNKLISSGYIRIQPCKYLSKKSTCGQNYVLLKGDAEVLTEIETKDLRIGNSIFIPEGKEYLIRNKLNTEVLLSYFKIPALETEQTA